MESYFPNHNFYRWYKPFPNGWFIIVFIHINLFSNPLRLWDTKSQILRPVHVPRPSDYFRSMGNFVNQQQGLLGGYLSLMGFNGI